MTVVIFVVRPDKITKYLLELTHEFGAPKARFFLSRGFPAGKPGLLAEALRRHPLAATLKSADPHPDGRKLCYECDLALPDGTRVCIRSIWIEQRDGNAVRLVTAYPFR